MYIFRALQNEPWFGPLVALSEAQLSRETAAVATAYQSLYAALAAAGHADLFGAAATALLYTDSPLAAQAAWPAAGLLEGARHDLAELLALVRRDWQTEVSGILKDKDEVPPLTALAAPKAGAVGALEERLRTAEVDKILDALLLAYRTNGAGAMARSPAFRWTGGALYGVGQPAWTDAARLVGLEGPLERLCANTEAFLAGRPAQHALLYGPRGSGKSTAVRSLGGRYAADGLRFVEVAPEGLGELPEILEQLRGGPHRYLLFVDDLAFGADSGAYGPLKSLLEGSLGGRPDNVRVYATSNRRHLVTERFSDRPDPLDDDPLRWDTQNERLALSDRFGLVITFPDATQRKYLEIVRSLAARDGLTDENLDQKAIRFADWGNGYSGRTAQQFVEALKSGLA